MCVPVVGMGDTPKAFLTGSIPYLELNTEINTGISTLSDVN